MKDIAYNYRKKKKEGKKEKKEKKSATYEPGPVKTACSLTTQQFVGGSSALCGCEASFKK